MNVLFIKNQHHNFKIETCKIHSEIPNKHLIIQLQRTLRKITPIRVLIDVIAGWELWDLFIGNLNDCNVLLYG